MPIGLVNPATQPQGAPGVPMSPIAGALDGLVSAYGKRFPTAAEQAEINQRNAAAALDQQKLGSGSELANTVSGILARQKPVTTTTQDMPPAPEFIGPMPTHTTTTPAMNTGDAMRAGLADLVKGAADSGDPAKASQLALLVSSYLPDAPKDIANQTPGTPTTQDMAMMAGGHPYAATPGGVLQEHTLGTPEMRNRNFKIQQIVAQHTLPNMSAAQVQQLTQRASDIVDGVVEGGLDPNTRQPYVLNKLDLMSQGDGAAPPAAAPAATAPSNSFQDAMRFVAGQEGGYTPNDGGKGPTAFGINSEANPDLFQNGATPTAQQAQQRIHDKYWNAIGGDNMDPAFAKVALDGAVNQGVGAMQHLIPIANGDPQKLLALRAQLYQKIASSRPDGPQLLPVWMGRLKSLGAELNTAAPANAAPAGAPPAAAAPTGPLKAGDDGFGGDTSQGYGGSGTVNMLKSMIAAVPDETGTNTGQLATDKISLFKKALLDLDQIRSGGKQSDMSRGLITNTLPTTGPIEDLGDVAKRATTGAGTAKAEANGGLDNVLTLRDQDQQIVDSYKSGKGTVSLADFQKAEASIIQEDSIIRQFASPTLQQQYNVRYNGAAAKPAPKTNLQKGLEATTPGAAAEGKVLKASEAAKLPVGATFKDSKGDTYEVVPGAERYKLVAPGGQ